VTDVSVATDSRPCIYSIADLLKDEATAFPNASLSLGWLFSWRLYFDITPFLTPERFQGVIPKYKVGQLHYLFNGYIQISEYLNYLHTVTSPHKVLTPVSISAHYGEGNAIRVPANADIGIASYGGTFIDTVYLDFYFPCSIDARLEYYAFNLFHATDNIQLLDMGNGYSFA